MSGSGAGWAADDTVWDVVVVGAGPAGSSAARAAAEAGATVLLLDRAGFPRYKTCGGGLLGESLRLIPERARATVESRVRDTVFTQRFGRAHRVRRPDAYLAMVRRIDFDQALVEAAQDAGVRFADGVTVRSIQAPDEAATARGAAADGSGVVVVETNAGPVRARVVIGADGAGGRVGRWVGVDVAEVDLGLEDELAMPDDDTRWRDRVLLDWGGADGSYAWVFPKRDSLTVGVIQRRGTPDQTREYLAAWRRHLGLADAASLHSSGHLTQWRRPGSPVRRGRVLVAGDTAGLLEPWTREGISFALRSGTWAGEAAATTTSTSRPATKTAAIPSTAGPAANVVAARALRRYEARVRAELEPEQLVGARVLAAFEHHPALVHALLRTPAGARFFVRFCSGATSLARFTRHPLALGIVDLLGRPRTTR